MVIWLGSEVMFFGGLFAAYFTLREHSDPWPGEGVHLETTLGILFTLVLIASSVTIHRAGRAGMRHDARGVVRWTAVTLLLAALFIANQAYEWSSLEFSISSHPFGSLFYLMTGFHGLHVLGGMAAMALLIAFIRRSGRVDAGAVESISLYWHFVDVVWILLFVTIFFVR
ncbi:MAG TPA: cytochrome c oxidase subunit 3 [Actinomycetota bacterium]|nr:cytochrome c oxidase subunit 3 [Actinomycetota bacterium]